jgi:hypothetical protein
VTTRPTKGGPAADPDTDTGSETDPGEAGQTGQTGKSGQAGQPNQANQSGRSGAAKQAPGRQPAGRATGKTATATGTPAAATPGAARATTPTGMPTGPATLADVLALLDRYRLRAHRMARAQYLAGKRAGTFRAWLGVPAVVAGAVVGSSIIASISIRPGPLLVLGAGVAALLTAGLTALQTFFGYAERAEKHRTAGATYTSFYRRLDLLALRFRAATPTPVDALRELTDLVEELDRFQSDALDVPDRFYDRSRREQERDTEGV